MRFVTAKSIIKYVTVFTILCMVFSSFGCLGEDDIDQQLDAQQGQLDNNTTVIQTQEYHDASMWEWLYWTSVWHNSFYMPIYYDVYTPGYMMWYHTAPVYRPVVVRPTVATTVYNVKSSKGTVLYTSTNGKAANNYKYRAAQRVGSGFGSNYKQTVSKNDVNNQIKNVNSGDKPKTWKDNTQQVKDMKQKYKSTGYTSSGSKSSSIKSSGFKKR